QPAIGGEHPLQRAEDVVADARPRMREGRDVVRDPHGAEYLNPRKRAPRTRRSALPGSASAGIAVGVTVKTARQLPACARSGTVRLTVCEGRKVTERLAERTVCATAKRFASLAICAVSRPPVQRRRV